MVKTITGAIRKSVSCDYRLTEPDVKMTNGNPLVMYLHGMGGEVDRGEFAGIRGLIPKYYRERCFYLHPFSEQGDIFDSDNLFYLLNHLINTNKEIDPNRIYLTGYSMGGRCVWNLACDYPDMFAAAAPVCGFSCYIRARRMAHVPTWTHHAKDDFVVPFAESEKMVNALRFASRGKTPHLFSAYNEGNHGIMGNVYMDENLWSWLFKQWKGKKSILSGIFDNKLRV